MASARSTQDLLQSYPGPLSLHPSRGKWLLILLGCAAFVAIGIWMVNSGEVYGWLPLVFFGLGIPIAAIMLLPDANALTLDADGFELKQPPFRRSRWAWQDVTDFTPVTLPPANIVLVGYDDAKATGQVADFNRSLSGRNAAFPDNYGLTPEQLTALLTQWRERALGVRP